MYSFFLAHLVRNFFSQRVRSILAPKRVFARQKILTNPRFIYPSRLAKNNCTFLKRVTFFLPHIFILTSRGPTALFFFSSRTGKGPLNLKHWNLWASTFWLKGTWNLFPVHFTDFEFFFEEEEIRTFWKRPWFVSPVRCTCFCFFSTGLVKHTARRC